MTSYTMEPTPRENRKRQKKLLKQRVQREKLPNDPISKQYREMVRSWRNETERR